MHSQRASIWLGLTLSVCVACARPAVRPKHVPAFPDALARPHPRAWAAFELTLDADGRVQTERVRVLGWEASGAGAELYIALRNVASGTIWDAPERTQATGRVVLVLDGAGKPLGGRALPRAIQARVDESIRVRRRAFAALPNGSMLDGAPPPDSGLGQIDAHDLDCAWMSLAGLRSGAPFLHDDVAGWRELEPRLLAAERADGGLWVGRLARRTHSGQFVFLDAEHRVLGVRRYILGE